MPVNPDYLPEAQMKILENPPGSARPDFKPPKNRFVAINIFSFSRTFCLSCVSLFYSRYIHLLKDDQYSPSRNYLSKAASRSEKACKYDLDETDTAWLSFLNKYVLIHESVQ